MLERKQVQSRLGRMVLSRLGNKILYLNSCVLCECTMQMRVQDSESERNTRIWLALAAENVGHKRLRTCSFSQIDGTLRADNVSQIAI
jgi:hypothetical protein